MRLPTPGVEPLVTPHRRQTTTSTSDDAGAAHVNCMQCNRTCPDQPTIKCSLCSASISSGLLNLRLQFSGYFCSILFHLSVPFCSTRDVNLSYPLHVKVGSSAGRQVAPPDIVSGHQVSPLEAVTSHVAFRR